MEEFIKRKLRRSFSRIFQLLPDSVQGPLLRRLVRVPVTIPKGIVFKIASTKEEIEQALNLVHDSYVHEKLISPQPNMVRITKYNASPFTTVLIAKHEEEVIATLSVIQDSSIGLPSDSNWDLSSLRKSNHRLAEISSLSIKRKWRNRQGEILLPLVKFLYEYSQKYAGIDQFIAVTSQKARHFYRHLLLFNDLPQKLGKDPYSFVAAKTACGMSLDLQQVKFLYRKIYWKRPAHLNLYRFFRVTRFEEMQYPTREYFKFIDPVMNPELFKYFFSTQSNVMKDADPKDLEKFRQIYHFHDFSQMIPKGGNIDPTQKRSSPRFPTAIKGALLDEKNQVVGRANIREVSRRGLVVRLESTITSGSLVRLRFPVSNSIEVQLDVVPVWFKPSGEIGVRIIFGAGELWEPFIDHLEEDLRKTVGRNKDQSSDNADLNPDTTPNSTTPKAA